jgi:hypothetical protein
VIFFVCNIALMFCALAAAFYGIFNDNAVAVVVGSLILVGGVVFHFSIMRHL